MPKFKTLAVILSIEIQLQHPKILYSQSSCKHMQITGVLQQGTVLPAKSDSDVMFDYKVISDL